MLHRMDHCNSIFTVERIKYMEAQYETGQICERKSNAQFNVLNLIVRIIFQQVDSCNFRRIGNLKKYFLGIEQKLHWHMPLINMIHRNRCM